MLPVAAVFHVLVSMALMGLILMHSGRDFAWLYDRQDQVSFLDGHVRAFAHFAAVPQRIAYDKRYLAAESLVARP